MIEMGPLDSGSQSGILSVVGTGILIILIPIAGVLTAAFVRHAFDMRREKKIPGNGGFYILGRHSICSSIGILDGESGPFGHG